MKLQHKHRASLIALALFTTLILLTWKPEPKASEDTEGRLWPLDIELKADLSAIAVPQEVVQDTLAWYAARLNGLLPGMRGSWRYEAIGGDDLASSESGAGFRSKLSLEFRDENLRKAVLRNLVQGGYVQVKASQQEQGWTLGYADVELVIPGTEQTLQIENVGYGLQIRGSRPDHYARG